MSEAPPETQPETPAVLPDQGSYRLPADYYAAPVAEVRPLFPRWVPIACGTASAVFLLVLFAAGAFLATGGASRLMNLVLGMMDAEMAKMYAAEVTPAQKQNLASELQQLRENVRSEQVPLAELNPIMMSLRSAIADGSVTAQEADTLVALMRKTNAKKRKGAARAAHAGDAGGCGYLRVASGPA